MNRVLLDTSAYSAFFKGDPAAVEAVQAADEIYLNPIVLGELLAGFIRGNKEKKNRTELETFLSSPRVYLQIIDEETSERYALILSSLKDKGTPIPTNDIWISALAMRDGLKILTTDRHYQKVVQTIVEIF
ncbi:MAG: type II toxin-antitoxin system VapC family toxin [Actinobacteria bacterium]|nr:type II toxin-antitoxin system VapC family toxin [Actinomycetota bacterium]